MHDETVRAGDVATAQYPSRFFRRRAAAQYLLDTYQFGAYRTLSKAAVTGDGPEFHKAGKVVLYTREALDRWALAKISGPKRSTSDKEAA